ncbi:SDR family oxidoreductase [Chitinophaga sp. sic0106]|uniref:SDR family oxidoreductase n=1 Tax=Chitinophaga sp. sic0106 TaxID=2854785 RepID=UPI001C491725|nr:SDR family oxidoreductase [Chitinophaga sp. sic0106]MBV7532484.1 SDR family oxidoreductase [Chitinophaga sp. sic0106]
MKIVVIGGTGLIGARLVDKLKKEGHTVIAAARQTGVNTLTGEGLPTIMRDTEVVIDVSNTPSYEGPASAAFFPASTTNLLSAEQYANVRHHIALSVVGAERLQESEYMRSKIAQEALIEASGVPYTILRSTQFFELAGRIANATTINDQVHISQTPMQPIAADEVVAALAAIAIRPPQNGTIEIAGPETMPMYELIRYFLNETEDSRQLIEDPQATYFGASLQDNSLLPGDHAILGKIRYEDWYHRRLTGQTIA